MPPRSSISNTQLASSLGRAGASPATRGAELAESNAGTASGSGPQAEASGSRSQRDEDAMDIDAADGAHIADSALGAAAARPDNGAQKSSATHYDDESSDADGLGSDLSSLSSLTDDSDEDEAAPQPAPTPGNSPRPPAVYVDELVDPKSSVFKHFTGETKSGRKIAKPQIITHGEWVSEQTIAKQRKAKASQTAAPTKKITVKLRAPGSVSGVAAPAEHASLMPSSSDKWNLGVVPDEDGDEDEEGEEEEDDDDDYADDGQDGDDKEFVLSPAAVKREVARAQPGAASSIPPKATAGPSSGRTVAAMNSRRSAKVKEPPARKKSTGISELPPAEPAPSPISQLPVVPSSALAKAPIKKTRTTIPSRSTASEAVRSSSAPLRTQSPAALEAMPSSSQATAKSAESRSSAPIASRQTTHDVAPCEDAADLMKSMNKWKKIKKLLRNIIKSDKKSDDQGTYERISARLSARIAATRELRPELFDALNAKTSHTSSSSVNEGKSTGQVRALGQKLIDEEDDVVEAGPSTSALKRSASTTALSTAAAASKKQPSSLKLEKKPSSAGRPKVEASPAEDRAAVSASSTHPAAKKTPGSRERSGAVTGPTAPTQKRPGISTAGAGPASAGKPATSSAATNADAAAGTAKTPGTSTGNVPPKAAKVELKVEKGMSKWDDLLYGGAAAEMPSIPRKANVSATSAAGAAAKKSTPVKSKAKAAGPPSAGAGTSVVVDMRDAERVVEGGEELTEEQVEQRKAAALAEYDDDTHAFNLLGFDENIILIEDEMHRWDNMGIFGPSRNFQRVGAFFARSSCLRLSEFLEVAQPHLNIDQQFARVREIRAASEAGRSAGSSSS